MYFRVMPVYDLQFTVVNLETGDEHGPYDSWEDVALAMAFARLLPGRVEVITDNAPAIAGHRGPELTPHVRSPGRPANVLPAPAGRTPAEDARPA